VGTALSTLNERILRETVEYRKGEELVTRELPGGTVKVHELYAMPPSPERGELVDVHFVKVGFTEASTDREAFLADLKRATGPGEGEFQDMPPDALAGGPSYITIGGWPGSQDLALRLIALGVHHGVWDVITPAVLGITGQEADDLAGRGFVMCSGLRVASSER